MSDNKLIGIIDTGTSNIMSVLHACNLYSIKFKIIKEYHNTDGIDGLIIPGVGSYRAVMENLKRKKLDHFIYECIDLKKPSLFICIGLQILFESSDEFGKNRGLSIFNGKIRKIPNSNKGKMRNVPMIGWNKLNINFKSDLLQDIDEDSYFFFTHSFYADVKDRSIIQSEVNYNGFTYCSSIESKNIFATQFHPEKSGLEGVKIYKNFYKIVNQID